METTPDNTTIWSTPVDDADPRQLSAYNYDLADDRIAADPADRRDQSRLLVYRKAGDAIEHRRFGELCGALDAGDLLVFNDTRVVPARIEVYKETGGRVELFVLDTEVEGPDRGWSADAGGQIRLACMTRSSRPLRPGMVLSDPDRDDLPPIEVKEAHSGRATVQIDWEGAPISFLEKFGRTPLPPYIEQRRTEQDRPPVDDADRDRYQTVFAETPGAVAAPTAGLHFTDSLLEELEAHGIRRAALTLMVGPGTFQPVRHDQLADHDMHSEDYCISPDLAGKIEACRRRGGRIISVGTTSARALEAEARRPSPFDEGWRSTDLFLRPGVDFQVCDGLITNFHLPKSTLLALVAGFVGYPTMRRVYEAAIDGDYRFYSYGDASLLLKS